MVHALSLVAEVIRNQYEDVNGLISNVKQLFLKAPSRIQVFRKALPDYPLPPEPVLTRWGSWIEATIYYFGFYNHRHSKSFPTTTQSQIMLPDRKCPSYAYKYAVSHTQSEPQPHYKPSDIDPSHPRPTPTPQALLTRLPASLPPPVRGPLRPSSRGSV